MLVGRSLTPAALYTSGLMMWLAPMRKSSGWLKMRKYATGKPRKRTSNKADTNQNERRERTKSGQPPSANSTALDEPVRKMRALGTKGKRGRVHESLNESHERK